MDQGTILLEGRCLSGDAEDLLQLLLAEPFAKIDWRTCDSAHTAVVQVLLAARCNIVGPPRDRVLGWLIGPALARGRV